MSRSLSWYIKLFLKTAFVVGLLYFLGQKGFISLQATSQALGQWERIIPTFLLLCLSTVLGAVRWSLLLKPQKIHLNFWRTFQLTLIGNFFNIALPGAVSGDFVKAFYVGQEVKGLRARAFGSILFDRVAGVSALALVSAGAMIALTLGHRQFPMLAAIRFVVIVAAICVLFFYSYLFLVREHHDPLLMIFKSLEKKVPRAGSLTRIYEGLRHYHNHKRVVLEVLGISIIIHLIVGWACLTFAQTLGAQGLSLLAVYVVVPLGLLVTAVPVMPAGLGTGHAAFLYLFHLIGFEGGADTFSLFALTNIVMSGFGGLVYLRFRAHEPKPVFVQAQASQSSAHV